MGRSCQLPLVLSSLFLGQFLQTAISCIGFGGCAVLGYPSYRCAPAYYSSYYPVGGCYGTYCRNRLKGTRVLALNESEGGGGGEEARAEEGEADERRGGGRGEAEERDGFGEVSPDALFLECCQSWSLPAQCLLKCSFSNYSAETLRSMFLRSDGCPIESASIIHFCASQNQDHRHCCLQAGIDQTKAGQKCLIFCDQMPRNETRLDLSYLPCFERFSEMKRCFYDNALRTIDYLEAELEEIRREQTGEGQQRVGAVEKDGFDIGRPPIIFVNDVRPKHPKINDDYFGEEEEDGNEEEEGEEEQKQEQELRRI